MIIDQDYIKTKDKEVAILSMALGVINMGWINLDGKMYMLFSHDDRDIVEDVETRWLSGADIMVNAHMLFRSYEVWNSNLHSFLDEKRYG